MDLFLDETKGWVIKSSHAFTVGLFHLDFLLPPPLRTQTHTTNTTTTTSVMVCDHKCVCFNFLVSTLAALTVFIGGLPELTIKARNF